MKKKIKKILVANRGEIALRVMKTCRELGIRTVGIYSEADANAAHVRAADEARCIGAPEAVKSYLNHDEIIRAALSTKADAIHPGYGFLSENAEFVRKVQKAGLIFIGPDADAIRKMGDKTAARKIAKSIDIPITPGTTEPVSGTDEALQICKEIGFPVLLKAAGGGGGKGMRIVWKASEIDSSLRASQSEARSAFGDDRIYIERYIENPHHIEVQILADRHGNVVHLGERECSVQRRHQKIVEESPSAFVTDDLRKRITDSAVMLVKESGYVNAGTIEFIVDSERCFYFLEMNTRLQVEHPVTEMRTGIDIVAEQIRIAEGCRLRYNQSDITFHGHALECRIYAEDPENNFYPSTGTIHHLRTPAGLGIREDRGIEEGDSVSAYYDPMLGKLITWGENRDEAIGRMITALDSYEIFGVRNNIRLCRWIVDHAEFRGGNYTTNFLNAKFKPIDFCKVPDFTCELSVIAAALFASAESPGSSVPVLSQRISRWRNRRWEE